MATALVALTVGGLAPMAGAAPATAPSAVGSPHHIGFAVPDLGIATARFADGLGTRFAPVTVTTVSVAVAGKDRPQSVTLRRTHSLDGAPVVVFEQASPAIGPWAAAASAPSFLSYAVPSLDAAGERFANSGFQRVATAPDFVFWRGVGGVLVRLIKSDAAPKAVTDKSVGLGTIQSFTLISCDIPGLISQFSRALGLTWKTPMPVPLPWQYQDGRTTLITHQVHASTQKAPHISVENPDPDPRHACTPTLTPVHLAYFTDDVAAGERQALMAGMAPIARVPMAASYFRSFPGGPYLEVATSVFTMAEYMP